jgi:hypothetical protein
MEGKKMQKDDFFFCVVVACSVKLSRRKCQNSRNLLERFFSPVTERLRLSDSLRSTLKTG